MKQLLLSILICTVMYSATDADNMPASFSHPGDLPLDSIPQFICYGFDDNCYIDGVTWVDDLFKDKKNPDGFPARATFYVSTHPDIVDQELWDAIHTLYKNGHEIGNHTRHHDNEQISSNLNSSDFWNGEISGANSDLLNQSNIPKEAITGFRTPFLLYSAATFQRLEPNGLIYDCSIEHGLGQYQDPSTGIYQCGEIWPYTLDDGPHKSSYATIQSKFPGLWELPVHEFMPATGWSGVTGLDWNIWFAKSMRKAEVIALWKSSLDIRVIGDETRTIVPNRAPLFMGMHSDEYTDDNGANSQAAAPTSERRAAVSEFLEYALQYDPAIRVVPMRVVIDWMKNPVPYTQFHWDPDIQTSVTSKKAVVKPQSVSARFTDRQITLYSPTVGKGRIRLYNVSGTLVADLGNRTFNTGKTIIPLRKNIARGIYLLKISGQINGRTLLELH